MFFLKKRDKKPHPHHAVGHVVRILPQSSAGGQQRVARYLFIRERRWSKSGKTWMYGGLVFDVSGGVLLARGTVADAPEARLTRVRGGGY